jgi:hypothetical protein
VRTAITAVLPAGWEITYAKAINDSGWIVVSTTGPGEHGGSALLIPKE